MGCELDLIGLSKSFRALLRGVLVDSSCENITLHLGATKLHMIKQKLLFHFWGCCFIDASKAMKAASIQACLHF